MPSTTGYSYKAYVLSGGVYTYGSLQSFTTLGALAITGTLPHGSVCPTVSATPITYTITNSGGVAAAGISVASSDAQFVVSSLSSTTIAGGGGTATYQVTFTPSSAGAKSATITVSSTTGGIVNVSNTVTGTGTTPVTAVVSSSAATSVATSSATLNGNLTTLGICPASTTRGFVYSITSVNATPTDGGTGVTTTSAAAATGTFNSALTGLSTGTGYSFRAYVFDGTTYTYGSVLTFTTLTPPANDDCSGAIALTVNAGATSGTVTNATQSIAAILCGGNTGTADDDVWYSFTTSVATNYTISVAGAASFDAVIDLRSGACDGTNIACADAGASGTAESITIALAATTTYYVRVYHYSATVSTTPTFTIAVTAPLPALSTNGTAALSFAATVQLTNSASQTFNLSGTNLTGFPADITVTAPGTDFQVSNDNSTWSSTATIAYTSATLSSTPVYVRFTPQSTGSKSGNVTFSGGGVASAPTVAVSGTGVLEAPVATAATSLSDVGFTANWNAVSGASSYRLDVSTFATFGASVSAAETFENSLTLFTEASGTGSYFSGSSTASDAPVAPFASQGTYGYGKNNGSVILTSSNINTTGVAGSSLTFKLASFSTGSTGNGADAGDSITVAISPDGGTTWYNTLKVIGNTNARWAFDATGSASTAYDADNATVNFTSGAGTQAAGYSTITITGLPQTANLRVAIALKNDNANERWLIDNFQLTGSSSSFVSGYQDLNVGSVTTYNVTGLTPNTAYYYRVRAIDGAGASPNSNVITATTHTFSVTNGDFRTKSSGNLSSTSLWQYNTGNAGYLDANQAPTLTNSVSVENGHTLTIDVDYKVGANKTFSIATGGAVIIAPAGNLEMNATTSTIALNGQPVTVRSTAAGTGSIGKILTPANLTGATNVTVERYISTGTGSKAWRLLASNTSGQTIKNAWQEGQAAMATNGTGFGTMITAANNVFSTNAAAVGAGFDKLTNGASILYQNQTTDKLLPMTSTTVNIATYPAYFLYVRGDRSADFTGAGTTATTAPTLRSTGSIFTGDQTVNVVTTAVTNPTGFTFTRNPFASAIDMTVVMATKTSGVSSTFQVWDPKIAGSYGLGGYQTFSANGGTFNISPGGGSYGTTGNIVESGAGIIFQGSGTVTIGEAAKVTGSTLTQRPSGTLDAAAAIRTTLYANNTATPVLADGNLLLIDDSYDNNLDLEDARKNTNFGENFGIKKDGIAIAIEKRRMPVALDTVFFNMSKLKAINYSLVFEPFNLPGANVAAVLEDAYTNSRTPVDLLATTTYNFTVDANAASSAANRFRLVFREQSPLPLAILLLKASQAGSNIAVEWNVSNQSDVIAYEVSKSTDAATFTNVATIAPQTGTGDLTYNWLDVNVNRGANFYRVKTVYQNGNFRYSPVARVMIGNAASTISVAPNPVKGNLFNLQLNAQPAGEFTIRVTNVAGQIIMSKKAQHNGGSASQTFTLPSAIVNGVYQLEVILPDNTKQVQKLIIDPAN